MLIIAWLLIRRHGIRTRSRYHLGRPAHESQQINIDVALRVAMEGIRRWDRKSNLSDESHAHARGTDKTRKVSAGGRFMERVGYAVAPRNAAHSSPEEGDIRTRAPSPERGVQNGGVEYAI